MRSSGYRNFIFNLVSRMVMTALAMLAMLGNPFGPEADAQTYTVVHNFGGGTDGGSPYSGLSISRSGKIYGAAGNGVFNITHTDSGWVLTPLYDFGGGSDGWAIQSGLTIGLDGRLYSTTAAGGPQGNGEVFQIGPGATVCRQAPCYWTKTVLYSFTGDIAGSAFGNLIFDHEGNIFGVLAWGGAYELGGVYKLTRSSSGWVPSLLYSFTGGDDGDEPFGNVVFDNVGNLYGTATSGGHGLYGTVYELTPSESGWTERTLYGFQGGSDGGYPMSGLIFDQVGNLYGTTAGSGGGNSGTVFRLSPSNGSWTFTTLHSFNGGDGSTPAAGLVMDSRGSFYGTTSYGGVGGCGTVFKLTSSGNGWNLTTLHSFTGDDGLLPFIGSLVFDQGGNLYGTTMEGGSQNQGVIFEITP